MNLFWKTVHQERLHQAIHYLNERAILEGRPPLQELLPGVKATVHIFTIHSTRSGHPVDQPSEMVAALTQT